MGIARARLNVQVRRADTVGEHATLGVKVCQPPPTLLVRVEGIVLLTKPSVDARHRSTRLQHGAIVLDCERVGLFRQPLAAVFESTGVALASQLGFDGRVVGGGEVARQVLVVFGADVGLAVERDHN